MAQGSGPGGSGDHVHPGPGVDVPPAQWPTGRLLSTVARRVERAWDAYLERWSLTHASLPALAVLAAGPLSQRELATRLDLTEQTVSRMLVRLERTGLVRRERDAQDRRRHVVAVTDHGRTALRELNDPAAVEGLLPHHLTPDQVRQLRRLLIAMLGEEDGAG